MGKSQTVVFGVTETSANEIMKVWLWQNRKLNLQWNNHEWTYEQNRTFNSLATALSVRLKGTITGSVNAHVIDVDLLVNDNTVSTITDPGDEAGNNTVPVDLDIWNFLYDPGNTFSVRIYKQDPTWGALLYCEIIANIYVELEYPPGGMPKPPTTPPPECFVATVAFGSPLAKELDVIRSFRDRRLPNPLVKSYYRWGKWLARFIEKRRAFKAWMRAFLWLVFVRKR